MQGFHAMGYFGGVAKVSRGPWFREFFVEDDGLDWFYSFLDNDGNKCYLLSNNLSIDDRNKMSSLYHTQLRNNRIGWFAGLWLGFETQRALQYCRTSAPGWRFFQWIGISFLYKSAFMAYSAQHYNPVMGAFIRKYQSSVKRDLFEIRDQKKEYFYIDTSQYMSYTNEDLSDEYHVHHGPQPVSCLFLIDIEIGRRITGQLLPQRGRQVPVRRRKQSQEPQEILQLPIPVPRQELPNSGESCRSHAQDRLKMKSLGIEEKA